MNKARVKRLSEDWGVAVLEDTENERIIYIEKDKLPKEMKRSSIVSYDIERFEDGRVGLVNVKIIGSIWDAYRLMGRRS